jgi:3'-phosphoadenosine 5'-phosphosulfate sulfotransferase (PAPS reductase)/FAD synthetase
LNIVEKGIRELHKNNFNIVRVKSKHGTLPEYIKQKKFYPSFHARFCTRLFKIEPIDDYLKQYEKEGVELMIGLNAEERDKRVGNHEKLSFVKYRYPLVEANLSRSSCEIILKKVNLHPNFPVYMKRGGCVGCFYKSKKEYEAMVHLSEHEFDQVLELEESIQDKRQEFYVIKKDMGSFRDFKKEIKKQPLLFNPEEIYSVVNNETPCGIFCNR